MPVVLLVSMVAMTPLSEDVIAGADVALRLQWGKLRAETVEALDTLAVLFAAAPHTARRGRLVNERFQLLIDRIETEAKVDLSKESAWLTLSADLQAPATITWAAVLRGAPLKAEPGPEVERRMVNDVQIYVLPEPELAWVADGDAVLVGDVRGVQRLLRQRAQHETADEAIGELAKRIRGGHPVELAFVLPNEWRRELAELAGELRPLIGSITAGTLYGKPTAWRLQLETPNARGADSLEEGLRAAGAWLQASHAALEAAGRTVLALDALGVHSGVAQDVDIKKVEAALERAFADPRLAIKVHRRPAHEVEASVLASHATLLWGALLVATAGAPPAVLRESVESEARRLLTLLRRAQFEHKRAQGGFFECGPDPTEVPAPVTAWPEVGCHALLGVQAPQTRVQLEARRKGEGFLLVARADPDGDGVVEAWWLDHEAPEVRRFGGGDAL